MWWSVMEITNSEHRMGMEFISMLLLSTHEVAVHCWTRLTIVEQTKPSYQLVHQHYTDYVR